MFLRKWCKILFLTLVLISSISLAFSVNANINVYERHTQTPLMTGDYSISVEGYIVVANPSTVSKIYEIYIPLTLDSLVGITKFRIDNSSERFYFSDDGIRGQLVDPGESIQVGYKIYGIVSYDLDSILLDNNITALEYYADSFDLSSNLVVNLQKPQREGYIYNNDGNFTINETPVDNTSRLITAIIRNPTDFNYTIKDMRLYATLSSDPMFDEGEMIQKYSNLTINPFDYKEVNFFHLQSTDNSVYWVSSYVVIDYILHGHKWPLPETTSTSSSTSGNFRELGQGGGGSQEDVLDTILVKKGVDKTIVRNGDEFRVILRIINVNDFSLKNLVLEDIIPNNYEIKDVSDSVKIEGGNKLKFNIDEIEAYDTYIISYTLVNNDELKGVTFLKPATLTYKNNSYYSEGVLVINDLLPEKKVFIQKEVKYEDDDYALVTIKVKNLGTNILENLLVSETLDDNSIIKEISQMFEERGIWRIKSLKPGEEWEVSYQIERNANLDNLPNIFGVEKTEVYGTLISSDEVITIFTEQPRTIEKVGMALAVGLLIFYLLF